MCGGGGGGGGYTGPRPHHHHSLSRRRRHHVTPPRYPGTGSVDELREEVDTSRTLIKAISKRVTNMDAERVTAEAKLRTWQQSNGPVTTIGACVCVSQ